MKTIINEELIGAFLECKTTPEESAAIIRTAEKDERLRNLLNQVASVDDFDNECIPCGAVAAETTDKGNLCAIICEQYVLNKMGIERDIEELEQKAVNKGWMSDGGMPIENMGCLIESEGVKVKRSFHNNVDSLKRSFTDGNEIIVMVDAAETCGVCNDDEKGYTPNHAVVVIKVTDNEVIFYDPDCDKECVLTYAAFEEAWNDSAGYMVTCKHEKNNLV